MTEIKHAQKKGLAGRVVRGGLWSLSGQGITLLASLLATPLTIRLLGPERYGVLALINLLVGYLAFSDWGMGTASTRFAAAAYAHEDEQGEAAAVWSALAISAVPVICAVGVLLVGAQWMLSRALKIPPVLQTEAVLALQIAAFGFLGRAVGNVLNTPQLVRLKLRLNASLTAGGSVLQIGLIPLVLWLGGGLIGAAAVVTGVSVLLATVHTFFSQRLLPQLFPPHLEWKLLRQMARFGGAVVLMNLTGLLLSNAEKILLTRFNSVKELAYYTVAFSLASILIIPMQALGQAMLPTFANLQAAGRQAELKQLYQEILRGVLLVLPLVLWAVCIGAKQFFIFWAGPDYGELSTLPFYILIIGLYANLATYVPYDLFVAFGRADFNARYHLLELGPYLLLTAWLTHRWGIVGAALAWSSRVMIGFPLYLIFVRRSFGLLSGLSLGFLLTQAVALLVMFVPMLAGVRFSGSWQWSITFNVAGLISYLGIVWFGLLNTAEKKRLRDLVQRHLSSKAIAFG